MEGYPIFGICFVVLFVHSCIGTVEDPERSITSTTISTNNATKPNRFYGTINLKMIGQPHNLYIGRCPKDGRILHQENIIVNNDGKSHVSAHMGILMHERVKIQCVKIIDQEPNGEGAYPMYDDGGVGHNFIEFTVTTIYGKGFKFYVEIMGEILPVKSELIAGKNDTRKGR